MCTGQITKIMFQGIVCFHVQSTDPCRQRCLMDCSTFDLRSSTSVSPLLWNNALPRLQITATCFAPRTARQL